MGTTASLFRRRNPWWEMLPTVLGWVLVFIAMDNDRHHLVCSAFRHGNNPPLLFLGSSSIRSSRSNDTTNIPPTVSRNNHPRRKAARLSLLPQGKLKDHLPISSKSRRRCTTKNNNNQNNRTPFAAVTSRVRRSLRPSRRLPSKRTARTTTTVLRGGSTVLLSATLSAPGLSTWLPPALLCGLAYALYNLFLKQASSSIDPLLGGVLLQMVAAILGTGLLLFVQLTNKSSATGSGGVLKWNRIGVAWAVAAGVAVGSAEILSFIISGMGVPASKSIPTIIGGSVLIGTILGVLWLGERLTLRGWLGIGLIAIGIGLVGIDPGSASSLH